MTDIRYGLRLLSREPVFAALVIGTLTLGIGASTSMFAVVNALLLTPLQYADPDRLVWMYGAFRSSDSAGVSPPDFVDYRARNDVFASIGAMEISPASVTVSKMPERLQASRVSAGLITTLGVPPGLGRDFAPDDETTASTAIIVSHRLWQDRFGGASDALGQSLLVDGQPRTIVGVMPAGFTLPYDNFIRLTEPVDLYLPLALDEPDAQIRRFGALRLIGRLKPGRSMEQAQSQMDAIARQLAAVYPENETWHLRLVPLHERIVGSVRPVLVILMGAVTLLLLVSCADVAGLLLARASTRAGELAVRGALGASRARVVRQLLVEGFVLSLAGSAAGLIVTWLVIQVLARVGPSRFPRLDSITFDLVIVAFGLAAAVATTVIFALVPALHAARGDLMAAMKPARASTQERTRAVAQRALVVAQLCVSVVLLTAAALLVRGFMQLVSVDLGFRPDDVMLMRVPLPPERYDTRERIDRYYSALLERLTATPGIERAALATSPPLAGANDAVVYRQGQPPASVSEQRFAQIRWIRGPYFDTLRIPIVAGRPFDDRTDRAGAPAVAIINRRMAREYFPNDEPLGAQLVVERGGEVMAAEVVGVSGDVRIFGQASEAPPMLYLHARQQPTPYMQLIVRSSASAAEVSSAIRIPVTALDPALAVSRIDRVEALIADSIAQPRFSMLLMGSFASLTLLLTLVGLYGTVAYLVTRRRREIGIRLALGATQRDIRQLVVRQGAALVAIGISLGLVASFFASRLAAALVFELRPAGLLMPATVAVLLTAVSFAAMTLPARRAARIEPLNALRAE
jgi:putative ABC transport system permease protein